MLHSVTGSLGDGRISGKCRGGQGAEYEVAVEFESHDAPLDWAVTTCSCPFGLTNNGLCKHSVGLLLARLECAAWTAAGGDPAAAEAAPPPDLVQMTAAPPRRPWAASKAPAQSGVGSARAAAGAAAAARAAASERASEAGGDAVSVISEAGGPKPRKRKLPAILTKPK